VWGTYKVLRAVIDDVKQQTAPAPNDLPAALWKFFQPAQDAPRELIPVWMNGGYPPEAWNLSITTCIPKGADAAPTTDYEARHGGQTPVLHHSGGHGTTWSLCSPDV